MLTLPTTREEEMQSDTSPDITRIVLFVLVLGILLAGTAWTLLPFLSGGIWATNVHLSTSAYSGDPKTMDERMCGTR